MGNAASWTLELEELLACAVRLERLQDGAGPGDASASERSETCSLAIRWRDPTYDLEDLTADQRIV